MIDGALGMAYGVSSNAFLLTIGVSPAIASASVHSAEVFTTAASGLSHFLFGNVDRKLFLKLDKKRPNFRTDTNVLPKEASL